jgi:hypothetical protein
MVHRRESPVGCRVVESYSRCDFFTFIDCWLFGRIIVATYAFALIGHGT